MHANQLTTDQLRAEVTASAGCSMCKSPVEQDPVGEGTDDRAIADTVNTLRDIAINFHAADQLRARIAHVVVPRLKRIQKLEELNDKRLGEIRTTLKLLAEARGDRDALRAQVRVLEEELDGYKEAFERVRSEMTTSEEQLQEWEVAATKRQYLFSVDLADLFAQAVPALIAELREARERLASNYRDGYKAVKEEYRQQVVELETKIEFQIDELVEKQKYILSLERKLAEAKKNAAKWRKYADEIRLGMDPRYVRVVVECVREDGLIYRNGELLLKSDAKAIGHHVGERLAEAVMETAIAAQEKP